MSGGWLGGVSVSAIEAGSGAGFGGRLIQQPTSPVVPSRSVGTNRAVATQLKTTYSAQHATLSKMTVRELLAELQHLPRDLEVLAFEAGCEDYCEREVDDYLAS